MRILSLHLVSSVLLAILLAGCADDLRDRNIFEAGVGDVIIRFDVQNIVATRSDGEQDRESAIDHAYLLFYPSEEASDDSQPLAAVRAEVSQANNTALEFKMPLRLLPDTDYRLIAIANADYYTPEPFRNYSDYLEAWWLKSPETREPLNLHKGERISLNEVTTLPMVGETADGVPFSFSMQNGSYSVTASLSFHRTVGRIDVANLVKDGFEVEGVALCNWRDGVPVSEVETRQGNQFGSIQGILSDESFDFGEDLFVEMPVADKNGIQQLVRSLYCFPSVSYDSYASDKESTAIIIKARYEDDTASSYYRVNVGTSGNKSEVKANTKYLVAIQSVKGRGASTPREAYEAEEPALVLSVVKEWDLDGCFAMDDNGNFIILSSGSLEFESDTSEKQVIRILTSGVLDWSATYIPDNDDSSDAFIMSRLSDNSMAIGPAGPNDADECLSGRFVVSATTRDGGLLSVDVSVIQNPGLEVFEPPVIPDDMVFALVPESYKRVKIDHEKKTIEIDAFDPDCFNSFIDVPFTVFSRLANDKNVIIDYEDMEWPLEGCISKEKHSDYCYISNSFDTKKTVFSKIENKEYSASQLGISSKQFTTKNGESIYISVGAMAPDDPAIVREISIFDSNWDSEIKYTLTIKPGEAVIDDVVLKDGGINWLIMDRNMQDVTISNYKNYIGRQDDGSRYQAYNFTNQDPAITIPFKYYGDPLSMFGDKDPMTESQHRLYRGYSVSFKNKGNLLSSNSGIESSMVYSWLSKYIYESAHVRTSPFYEQYNYLNWVLPSTDLLDLCVKKMRVSKMRMYLVSDVPVKEGKKTIPVCCYWPYDGVQMDDVWTLEYNLGYYASDNAGNPVSLAFIYCDKSIMKIQSTTDNIYGWVRLVRPLSTEELSAYKTDYLGYGSPHRLTLCHPDSYESSDIGWILY